MGPCLATLEGEGGGGKGGGAGTLEGEGGRRVVATTPSRVAADPPPLPPPPLPPPPIQRSRVYKPDLDVYKLQH